MEFRIPHLKGAGPIVNDVLHKLGASIALAWRWHDIQLISAKKVKMESEFRASTALAEIESGALREPPTCPHGPHVKINAGHLTRSFQARNPLESDNPAEVSPTTADHREDTPDQVDLESVG